MVGSKDSFYARLWGLNPFLCKIGFVLLAGTTSKNNNLKKNEYNMFGEYITVIKIPSWISHLSSRMVERIKLRIGRFSPNLAL